MSKLIDKLNKLTRSEPTPIGFRREQSASAGRKIQLIAELSGTEEGKVAGVDAVLFDITGKDVPSGTLTEKQKDVPWGGWLKAGGVKGIAQLRDAGCDFVVFSAADAPLTLAEDKEMGRILEVDTSMSDGMLRTVVELPVDAVLVSVAQDKGDYLTYRDLMVLQRFGGFPGKSLIVRTPAKLSGAELEALWEAGVTAIVAKGNIDKLRKVIDKTEFPSARKRDKAEPVLRQSEPDTSLPEQAERL